MLVRRPPCLVRLAPSSVAKAMGQMLRSYPTPATAEIKLGTDVPNHVPRAHQIHCLVLATGCAWCACAWLHPEVSPAMVFFRSICALGPDMRARNRLLSGGATGNTEHVV